ncbi:ABC transporter permease [Dyella tabacisoli]|uniref:ABC transporter permease n=1 Tax=Dyella tabacisoli TaxID=2282381 RepID=A0A369UQV8_9GAMM|nr:ABC transporter permease [Dyella tabacisoli]RDD83026.1 ABC transporter permease [Dyella tabacisoli]
MFAYYFQLGLRSLHRNPVLTALMVMAIGFGVAASMTIWSVFRATSGNPIPQKSSTLFIAQVDNYGKDGNDEGEPLPWMTYTDAMALQHAHQAKRQTALYSLASSVIPADPQLLPFPARGYGAFGDFFPMFDVPFLFGSGWSAAEDEARASVVVIGRELNDKIFGGANSVGREINLDGVSYRIVGVTDRWEVKPRFFDLDIKGGFGVAGQIYLPFNRAMDLKKKPVGATICNRNVGTDWDSFLHSECVWLSFWAELPTAAQAANYRQYLHGYAAEQQRAGRFGWAPNVRLRDVMQWLSYRHVVPKEARISLLIAISFLLICLVNTAGLLLAKFMRRAPEIGVRRALGASKQTIYAQFLIEAGTVGLAGAALGLLLTALGMLYVDRVFDSSIAKLAHIDVSLVGLTIAVSILSTLLAAFYPTWRAAQVQPAWQLKSN